jgi:PAS domain S-box-containing protein
MRGLTAGVLWFVGGSLSLSLFTVLHAFAAGCPLFGSSYLLAASVGGLAGLATGRLYLRLARDCMKIQHFNQVLCAVRSINQLLLGEENSGRLLEGICRRLVQNRGYYHAWVALVDASEQWISAAQAGLGEEYQLLVKRFREGDLTPCARKALGRSEVVIVADPVNACSECPLSGGAGGRAAMTVRLEHGGHIYGLLSVSISKELVTDEKEQELLAQVASDIAFGLHSIALKREQERTQHALQESEKRFRDLVESALTGIFIIQEDRIVYKNPEQKRQFGPLPTYFHISDFEGIHPDDIGKVRRLYERLRDGTVDSLDADIRFFPTRKNNSRRHMKWVYCRASAIRYRGKEAILVNTMDITRDKEMEHLLRIQDKMTSLGRVAAGIAHEIRNPLSGINIYVNTLKKIYDRAESLDKVKDILLQLESASGKIESVVKRVIDFSRPAELKCSATDINQPIEEAVELSVTTLRKSGIRIEKRLTENLPPCRADAHLIEEVILNMITNAAEAMKNLAGDKKIAISSAVEDNHILVKVSDSGPGVPVHMRTVIFDPFYTTKNGSTGIGLSLSHRIITDHGGSLQVGESQWGGAEFVIEIPLAGEAKTA